MSTERQHLIALSRVHDLISITVCYALLQCFNDDNPLRLSNGFQYTKVFNLHAMNSKITIKKDEMSRYCYLIDHLSRNYLKLPKKFINHYMDENEDTEELKERYRKEWIIMMLEIANVSYDHFKSHYRDAVNSETKKNVSFKKNLEKFEEIVKAMTC